MPMRMSAKTLITDKKIEKSLDAQSKSFIGPNAASISNMYARSGESFGNLRSRAALIDD